MAKVRSVRTVTIRTLVSNLALTSALS
jgi:hypothetical protein